MKYSLELMRRAVRALERIADHITQPTLNVREDGTVTTLGYQHIGEPVDVWDGKGVPGTRAARQRYAHGHGHFGEPNEDAQLDRELCRAIANNNRGATLIDTNLLHRMRNFIQETTPIPEGGFNAELIEAWHTVRGLLGVEPIENSVERTQIDVRLEVIERVRALVDNEETFQAAQADSKSDRSDELDRYELSSVLQEFVSKHFIGGANVKRPVLQELFDAVTGAAPDKAGLHVVHKALGLGSSVSDEAAVDQLTLLMSVVDQLRAEWPGNPQNAYPWAVLQHVRNRLRSLQEHHRRTDNGPSAAALVDQRTGVVYLQTSERLYKPVVSIDEDGRPVTKGLRIHRDEIEPL